MSLVTSSPIVINDYNISALNFQVGPMEDFSHDWVLRQKEFPNFLSSLPQQAAAHDACSESSTSTAPTQKKHAYYMDLSVEDNQELCFQNVVIQKSPIPRRGYHNSTLGPGSQGIRYGRDYFLLGIPMRTYCELNQNLALQHSIPIGNCRHIVKGDFFWILARPPPVYPPQLVDEDLESFFLQWDDFVRNDLSGWSWSAHVIGNARLKTEGNRKLVDGDDDGNYDVTASSLGEKHQKSHHIADGDFSIGMTVQKIVLIERVEVETPSLQEFAEQKRACFVRGHENELDRTESLKKEPFVKRFGNATAKRYFARLKCASFGCGLTNVISWRAVRKSFSKSKERTARIFTRSRQRIVSISSPIVE